MRGKRSKQYRKLMHQYSINFKFHEPYQILLDAEIIQDASRFSMDLVAGLERTVQGNVKPMLTQCSMRHLYATKDQPLIEKAKAYERRHCNHHELETPLSAAECITSIVDPKGSNTNKNRYVVATQDVAIRAKMRQIPGVPLIYINRSVMIMEPMAASTGETIDKIEKSKFREGLKGPRSSTLGKRKREEEEEGKKTTTEDDANVEDNDKDVDEAAVAKKKKKKGPKGPNPLSVKKSKNQDVKSVAARPSRSDNKGDTSRAVSEDPKKKRKRRRKPQEEGPSGAVDPDDG
ncbi:hypothetical protein K402DRAFT_388644 [Aulographum hederae CBS 113979]|uniref:U three protein 23 n=1 Tax=Aulographum hederae CBS 113979 TaxID=1176131 RepID=A0A6G1HGL3_9PEZI|nr:hypothetical protein K402DRAFT_388644 [Aulographum hederae CBS 113979]